MHDPDLTRVLERSRELGFLGPGPVEDHIAHAERLLEVLRSLGLPAQGHAVDLGSGGGVPGLVVAQGLPDWTWTLLDAMERRTAFLRGAVEELGLTHATVWRVRAEEAGRTPQARGAADLVVARSFASPAVTAECAAPLLAVGGWLVVSEPPAPSSTRWSPEGLRSLGFDPRPGAQGSWIAYRLVDATPERYPRKVGQPGKRPLW